MWGRRENERTRDAENRLNLSATGSDSASTSSTVSLGDRMRDVCLRLESEIRKDEREVMVSEGATERRHVNKYYEKTNPRVVLTRCRRHVLQLLTAEIEKTGVPRGEL